MNQSSGCGSVGRAVASDTKGLQFESSRWQLLLNRGLLALAVCRKDENKEKEAGNGTLKKVKSIPPSYQ